MKRYMKRTVKDFTSHAFLHSITVVTIALTILIAGALLLVVENGETVIASWKNGVRIMVYLKGDAGSAEVTEAGHSLETMGGVAKVSFISRDEALTDLMESMEGQVSLFEGLGENPLPDAYEVEVTPEAAQWDRVKAMAAAMMRLPAVDEVEYGRSWLARVSRLLGMMELAGIALAGLFFIVALFIVYNTVRLALYSRRDEIEIMQLVGATGAFIKIPLYLAGVMEGAMGSILALVTLFGAYALFAAGAGGGADAFPLSFLSLGSMGGVILYGIFVGWFGCFLSLREFMKEASS
ncbi:permease-like cell division protein FtsX [Desulfoluna sp.]|uniref:cell division protein FtsX n=1 Tax=Desulfoluna sp. TaxID=2045199 RepID=UPI002632EE4B|nr:permease-like cell division protein FtsX [Desulfoluna sp.]